MLDICFRNYLNYAKHFSNEKKKLARTLVSIFETQFYKTNKRRLKGRKNTSQKSDILPSGEKSHRIVTVSEMARVRSNKTRFTSP